MPDAESVGDVWEVVCPTVRFLCVAIAIRLPEKLRLGLCMVDDQIVEIELAQFVRAPGAKRFSPGARTNCARSISTIWSSTMHRPNRNFSGKRIAIATHRNLTVGQTTSQ